MDHFFATPTPSFINTPERSESAEQEWLTKKEASEVFGELVYVMEQFSFEQFTTEDHRKSLHIQKFTQSKSRS